MSRKYRKIGPETLEMVETAPLPLLQEIIAFRDSDSEPTVQVKWPEGEDEDDCRLALLDQLNAGPADGARPLEDRCRRVRRLAMGKGPTSLEHVARILLSQAEQDSFNCQPDALCRSAWSFLRHPNEFEDAEAFYTARQYRDYGKMYDSFEIDADEAITVDAESIDEKALISLLTAKLELPSEVTIRTLDLPKTTNYPPSVMVIVRHGGPLSSVFNHKDNGMRGTIYYRPPNEVTLIWTPAGKVMEICGPSPQARTQVGDAFAEIVLKADLSTKPLNWRHYDLSRFHESLNLPLPDWDDVEISAAKLIEVELRLGNWARRLTLRVTIEDDIEKVADHYLGGNRLLKRAEGFSRLIIAVRYSRPEDGKEHTLEISFGDRRSNLQSKGDPDERDLGYRLLWFWGIINRLRELDHDELMQLLPRLLDLHDLPEADISGGQLRRIGLDPKRLLDAGIIGLRGRQSLVLIDEEDTSGDVEVAPGVKAGEVIVTSSFGQDLGALPLEDVRQYIIKRDWLEETLLAVLKPLVGRSSVEQLDSDLSYLGRWRTEDAEIPVYFARRIEQPKTLQRLDVILRSRQDGGIGIVLAAGRTPFTHLGQKVVMALTDVVPDGEIDGAAKAAIFERFKVNRWLALGGSEVALLKFGPQSAMLYIPSLAPLPVSGLNQMLIIERLVAAYKAGTREVRTGLLIEDTGVKSPADAWPSKIRSTVAGVYFENSRQGYWRLKSP